MTEDTIYQTKIDIPQATTGEHILFGPGHTFDLQGLLPGLHSQEGAQTHYVKGETEPQELLTLTPEAIVHYVEEHKVDQPHAVATVIQLACEEIKQTTDPQRTVQYLKTDVEQLNAQRSLGAAANPDEVADIERSISTEKEMLRASLILLPKQIIALQTLLSNSAFTGHLEDYLKKYGEETRVDSQGRPTTQTHYEFVVKHLQDMKVLIDKRLDQIGKAMNENPTLEA